VSSIVDAAVVVFCLFASVSGPQGSEALLVAILHGVGIVVCVGAIELLNRGSWRWAVLASVLATIPVHWGAIVGIPVGIWSFFLLKRPETKSQFNDTRDFGPELEYARQKTSDTFARVRTRLSEFNWKSLFSYRQLLLNVPRIRRFRQLCGGLMAWGLVCLLTFSVTMLLVARYAQWEIVIIDHSANRVSGVSGRIDLRATGSVSQTGVSINPAESIRDEVVITLHPKVAENPGAAAQTLRVSVPDMKLQTSSPFRRSSEHFDEAAVTGWMESMGIDVDNPAVQREAKSLTELVYEVARDQWLGITADREMAQLIDKKVFGVGMPSYRAGVMIEQIPSVLPMAVVCTGNALLWLGGLTVIMVSTLRRSDSHETTNARRRLMFFMTTVTILILWSLVAYFARPLVATHLPRALANEFPQEFSVHDPSAGLISDLTIGVVWTACVLLVSIPAWTLSRTRTPRLSEQESDNDNKSDSTEPTDLPAPSLDE